MMEHLVKGDVIVRDCRPEDDAAINELEKRASQHRKIPIIKYLFKASIKHITRFNAKATQFDSHHIVCLEDTSNDKLCGVVVCGCKTVWFQGKLRKCAYIFDLRVDEDYQGRGLGTLISKEVEARCIKDGIEFLYLTVNGDNAKAKALYKKLGFVIASRRWPCADLLREENLYELPAGASLELLNARQAAPVFQEAYTCRDMSLACWEPLLSSPLFQVALVAKSSDGRSSAGVCLWDAGSFHTMVLERFFVPMVWFTDPVVKLFTKGLGLLLAGGALALTGTGLWRLWASHAWISLSVTSIAVCAGAVALCRAWPIISSILGLLGRFLPHDGPVERTRGRLFAPFASGPDGLELLTAVLPRARAEARDRGFLMVICNIAEEDPLRDAFGPGRFRTEFLQKHLVPGFALQEFSTDSFHDPRDI